MEAREVIDAEGCYVSCGFIESHLHVEGLHLLPEHYSSAFLAHGTTTVITDLHEIANAGGMAGLRWYLSRIDRVPLDLRIMAPSCVPSSKHERGLGRIGIAELKKLKKLDSVIGLGEVMDLEGVWGRNKRVMDKIGLFEGRPVDGHAPGLVGDDLDCYASAGIHSDHETTTADGGDEKLRRGMHLFLREGSVAKDLVNLIPLIRTENLSRLSLCTDDLSARDLFDAGHLDRLISLLVRSGIPLLDALRLVTVNPALYFTLSDRNALAVGRKADLVIFDRPDNLKVRTTIKDGRVVYRDGTPVDQQPLVPPEGTAVMKVRSLSPEDLRRRVTGRRVRVMGVSEGSIVTEDLDRESRTEGGYLAPDPDRDIVFAYVFDRYRAEEAYGFGLVHGFSIRNGAIGSTYAHDSHNLVVVGDNIRDIYSVIQSLRECGGGMAASQGGRAFCLPMPYFGIISSLDGPTFLKRESDLNLHVRRMGVGLTNPFFQMSFLSLPVIPQLRLTTKGLFHVPTSTLVQANHD
jgi:adenine deaminase